MNRSKSQSDYEALAENRSMKFLGKTAPRRVTDPAEWRCLRCNRPHIKAYNTLKFGENPCRCWNDIQVTVEEYKTIAEKLSKTFNLTITLVQSQYIVKNTREQVEWCIESIDTTFWASYRELVYGGIARRVRKILNDAKKALSG